MKLYFFPSLFLLFSAMVPSILGAGEPLGEVTPFALIDQKGKLIQKKDLLGKVWAANFIFTRCEGPCPALSANFRGIQDKIPKDALLLSFTMDPEFDSPPVLDYYADSFGAKPGKWMFLTGSKKSVQHLLSDGFRLSLTEGDPDNPGTTLIHSTQFALVDSEGKIRAYIDGENSEDVKKIPFLMKQLTLERDAPWAIRLPAANAALNLAAAVFLLLGLHFIRAKNVLAHRACMGTAFFVSVLFLASYLAYHQAAGSVGYSGQGWMRSLYFTVLLSHTALAAVVLPLVSVTFYYSLKSNFERHKKLARWTFPIWLYVSITGVAIYRMLYL